MSSNDFPTDEEKQANRMRESQGLSDGEIAELLGVSRETVNRRINRFRIKERKMRLACAAGSECSLLEFALG